MDKKRLNQLVSGLADTLNCYDEDQALAAIERRGVVKFIESICTGASNNQERRLEVYVGDRSTIELIVDNCFCVKLDLAAFSDVIGKINENVLVEDSEPDLFNLPCKIYPDEH